MNTLKYTGLRIVAFVIAAWTLVVLHQTASGISYSYDSLNRLTNVDYGNGSVIRYTYDAAGNRLTYSGVVANDSTDPAISIISPTSSATFATTNATISLSGTASDNIGVSLITWANDGSGTIGTALGATSWRIDGIQLQPGANDIWLTAFDFAGNEGYAALTVVYTPPPVIGIASVTIASNATVNLTVTGPVGEVLAVQTSTNLIQWHTITIVANATGSFPFTYPFSKSESKRFFRALPAAALPTSPQLSGMALSGGMFHFALNGLPGSNYVIQVSSNLVNWSAFATNVIPAGGFRVLDFPVSTNQPRMFYRAVPLAGGPLVLQPGPQDAQDIWTANSFTGVTDGKLWVGGWGDTYYDYLKFDLSVLPRSATSATVWLYSGQGPHPSTRVGMYLDRVTQSWDALYATGIMNWSQKPSSTYLRTLAAPSGTDVWYAIDVTDLYNAWQAGTYANYGIALRPLGTSCQFNYFRSSRNSDSPMWRPKLVVTP